MCICMCTYYFRIFKYHYEYEIFIYIIISHIYIILFKRLVVLKSIDLHVVLLYLQYSTNIDHMYNLQLYTSFTNTSTSMYMHVFVKYM